MASVTPPKIATVDTDHTSITARLNAIVSPAAKESPLSRINRRQTLVPPAPSIGGDSYDTKMRDFLPKGAGGKDDTLTLSLNFLSRIGTEFVVSLHPRFLGCSNGRG